MKKEVILPESAKMLGFGKTLQWERNYLPISIERAEIDFYERLLLTLPPFGLCPRASYTRRILTTV